MRGEISTSSTADPIVYGRRARDEEKHLARIASSLSNATEKKKKEARNPKIY